MHPNISTRIIVLLENKIGQQLSSLGVGKISWQKHKSTNFKRKNYTQDSIKINTPITKCFYESALILGNWMWYISNSQLHSNCQKIIVLATQNKLYLPKFVNIFIHAQNN